MTVSREQVVQTAEKLVSRGKIEAAIREYRKVLSDQPNDPTTLNRIGDLYARIDRTEDAVGFFGQIAESYTGDGFFVKAIAIYKKIIKLDPTRLEVYERLAELYHRQGLVNEARTQYQVLADYYVKHENKASALSIYERLAQLEPDNPRPRAKLAELYQEQQLIDKAMGEYRTIAELMIANGQPEQAAQVFDRALDVSSEDLGFIGDAVGALRRAGQIGAAAKLLTEAIKRNPEARTLARPAPVEEPEAEEAIVAPAEAPAPPESPPPVAGPAGAGESVEFDLAEIEPDLSAPVEIEAAGEIQAGGGIEAGGEIELDLDEVFVFDLDADEAPASLVTPPPDMLDDGSPATTYEAGPEIELPAAPGETAPEHHPPPGADGAVGIDAVFLERTASELHPQRPRHQDDLFTEAEVLAKYSLDDKAAERLQEVLQIDPGHLDAMALLIRIDLDKERYERAAELANEMIRVATERDDLDAWAKVRTRLVAAGFEFDGDRVVGVPTPAPDQAEEKIGRLLEDLLEAAPSPPRRPLRPSVGDERVDAAIAEIASRVRTRRGKVRPPAAPAVPAPAEAAPQPEEVAAPPAPAPPPGGGAAEEVASALEASGVVAGEAAPTLEDSGVVAGEAAPAFEDSGVAWLDDVGELPELAHAAGAPAPASDVVFAEEEEFFDLAAELEQELSAEDGITFDAGELEAPREQTLEEIVEGFKRGVADSLSPQDYDTHFNLGIAYREMGLLDEAIGEFQLAAKSVARLVECCSMLGICFLDKGLPELAVRWYRRGLEAPGLTEEESQGLLYDLGNTYLATGDLDSARETFVEVYGTNSNYRDVVAKLEEIASR